MKFVKLQEETKELPEVWVPVAQIKKIEIDRDDMTIAIDYVDGLEDTFKATDKILVVLGNMMNGVEVINS